MQVLRIKHPTGAYIEVSDFGATWLSAVMPDKYGQLTDVLLGYTELDAYRQDTNYIGGTIGRFANRIGMAQFSLNGKTYQLDKNDRENCNHGGFKGLNKRLFLLEKQDENSVTFSIDLVDGEGGFPGNVHVTVTYQLTFDLCVRIKWKAFSDKDTIVNLTNHAYFNLFGSGDIKNHVLWIASDTMLETNEHYIPTGKILSVIQTPFDFTQSHSIGERLFDDDEQLRWNRGYNHCYPVSDHQSDIAVLSEPQSGRQLRVRTTQPAILIYSGNYLKSNISGKWGRRLQPYDGIALETQNYPDAPNHPLFPSAILRAGEMYEQKTEYQFTIINTQ